MGLQVNLPFSKRRGDCYWHWNAGFTWLPGNGRTSGRERRARRHLMSPFLAGSAIYRLRPMFHLMLESVLLIRRDQSFDGIGERAARTTFTLSPGVRGGWNSASSRSILGLAVPITWGAGDTETGLLPLSSTSCRSRTLSR